MSAVVPFGRRCGRCGDRTETATRVLGETETHREIPFVACPGCIAKVSADLDSVRPVFDAMVAAGVPRDLANATMTFMLERLVQS